MKLIIIVLVFAAGLVVFCNTIKGLCDYGINIQIRTAVPVESSGQTGDFLLTSGREQIVSGHRIQEDELSYNATDLVRAKAEMKTFYDDPTRSDGDTGRIQVWIEENGEQVLDR
jgi:hypothetical protein